MPFVKLDSGLLNSTLWFDKTARDVFITSLLMAVPHELMDPEPQLHVDSLQETGFTVPAGWYGLVESAAIGILSKALVDRSEGLQALTRLGEPDPESRSADFEGRRLVRIDGGYLVLNYQKYRERDYGAADRMRRMRAQRAGKKASGESGMAPPVNEQARGNADPRANGFDATVSLNSKAGVAILAAALDGLGVTPVRPNNRNVPPNVTQAEAEEEKYISQTSSAHPPLGGLTAAKTPKPKTGTKHERFPEFWDAWPKNERKHDKAKCCEHWARHDLDKTAEAILADVRGKRGSVKWTEADGKYIEAPLTYLRGKRWEDGTELAIKGKPWYETGPGIQAKGVELGVGAWDREAWEGSGGIRGEPWVTYAKRVFAKAGFTPTS